MTKQQLRNAERIAALARAFGDLYYNASGQTPRKVLNLSIPCAELIVAGIVTGVADTNDGVNQAAVDDVERYCRAAVAFATEQHGAGWWSDKAAELLGDRTEHAMECEEQARRAGFANYDEYLRRG